MPAMDNKEYRRRLIARVEALLLISSSFATPQADSHVRTTPNSDQRDTPHSDQSYTQALIGHLGL
jgi:hypothetical protein